MLLAPLAGLAALYAAAAINSNSALVTLATLNTGKKKRSAGDLEEQDLLAMEEFLKEKPRL